MRNTIKKMQKAGHQLKVNKIKINLIKWFLIKIKLMDANSSKKLNKEEYIK